jgi:hypothetical protein
VFFPQYVGLADSILAPIMAHHMSVTNMKLDEKQQSLLMQGGKLGMDIFDSLVNAGCTSAEAEELQKDAAVRDLFHRGRSEGSRMVHEVLATAAKAGNISAVKLVHRALQAEPEAEKPQDTRSDGERRAEWRRIIGHVNWTFERLRVLHEGTSIIGTQYERDPY